MVALRGVAERIPRNENKSQSHPETDDGKNHVLILTKYGAHSLLPFGLRNNIWEGRWRSSPDMKQSERSQESRRKDNVSGKGHYKE